MKLKPTLGWFVLISLCSAAVIAAMYRPPNVSGWVFCLVCGLFAGLFFILSVLRPATRSKPYPDEPHEPGYHRPSFPVGTSEVDYVCTENTHIIGLLGSVTPDDFVLALKHRIVREGVTANQRHLLEVAMRDVGSCDGRRYY